jgi:hypothetical protein
MRGYVFDAQLIHTIAYEQSFRRICLHYLHCWGALMVCWHPAFSLWKILCVRLWYDGYR